MATESGGTYLPPVIASLVGTSGDLASTLIEAKAMLDEFAATDTTAHITADVIPSTALVPQMLAIRSMVQANFMQAGEIPLHFTDVAELFAEKAGIDEILKANFREAGLIPVHIDVTPLLTGMVEAETIIDAEWREIGASAGSTAGASAADHWWTSFMSRMAVLGAAAGAFNLAGLGKTLGFGTGVGMGIPGLAGAPFLAGFGTIGGLMGFSIEHVLTTILGLAGSLSEAFMGLGVIAVGAFASMAVGMGSDMAVMKSTIADTQALYKLWTNLQDAVLVYGANSSQAQLASQQLNAQLKILGNTAGVQAELGLAKLAFTINQQWDRATSNARVQAVGLLTQILLLGRTYIPLVAQAAEQNLSIINQAIKPLFTWLEGPQGMGIFLHLESVFKADLPTAIDTFNKAIEFLLRFLDLASNYTSGFMQYLDKLFTYLNSSTGFARVERDVNNVVAVFRVWQAFIVILTKDIVLLLGQTVGVGTSIIQSLTGMLTKLHDYLTSTSGKQAIGSLFEAHKAEILAILQLIPKLAGPVSQIYLALAVPLTNIATAIANIIGALVTLPGVGPVLAWGLAFFILAQRMQLAAILMGVWRAAVIAATAATIAFDIALDANLVAIIIIAIIALIAAIVLLVTHWKEVTTVVQNVWKQVTHWVGQLVADVGKFFSNLGTMVEKAWSNFAARPGYWLGYTLGTILGWVLKANLTFDKWFAGVILKVIAWGENMAKSAPGALAGFIQNVIVTLGKIVESAPSIGASIAQGLWKGLQGMGPWLLKQIEGFMQGLIQGALHSLGSHSPSEKFARVGETIPMGVGLGINRQSSVAMVAMMTMFSRMMSQGQSLTRGNFGGSSLAFAGAGASGRGPVSISMPINVNVSGAQASSPQGIGSAVQVAVRQEFERLIQALDGGASGALGST